MQVPYEMADFPRVPKFDAHVHANVADPGFVEQARVDGFAFLTINVDNPDFLSLADQRAAARRLAQADPERVHWSTTFSMRGFGEAGWLDRVLTDLTVARAQGARGVKIWKDVGMSATDADGRLVGLDHPGLAPVVEWIEESGLVLIGHQGEPHNCWLPLDQMSTDCDRRYFLRRPQQHMHQHPTRPHYDDLMAMRDRFLTAHPGLRFVGAHMGSLEHDVDRLSAFLDRFPDVAVDLASRLGHVQHQSLRDHERVRAFFLGYQDRLLYGTDLTYDAHTDPARFPGAAHRIWTSHWRYLATTQSQYVDAQGAEVPGLALPRDVIDKVYRRNAARVFGIGLDQGFDLGFDQGRANA